MDYYDEIDDETNFKLKIASEKRKQYSALMAGMFLGLLASVMVAATIYTGSSSINKNVASLLAGMFGFASVEAFRRSF